MIPKTENVQLCGGKCLVDGRESGQDGQTGWRAEKDNRSSNHHWLHLMYVERHHEHVQSLSPL